jgi:N,N'-diacetyllegionaminate synthase
MKTVIIAEAGVNHNGDIDLAKEMIDVAAQAGADFVKFQTFRAESLTTKSAPAAKYQITNTQSDNSQFEMLKSLELSIEAHKVLISHAKKRKIKFLSTAFDIQSINMLASLGQEIFKVPSGEITNLPYLRHLGSFRKRIILSTGMSNIDEISSALKILELAGTPRSNMIVMHCTSAYPTPMSDVNLLAIKTTREILNLPVGYSDHTLGVEVPIAAVALGATVIEKHFTIDRDLPGPDHKASLDPRELIDMVRKIRNLEEAMGDGNKRIMPSEKENFTVVRKSIVAKTVIQKDEKFTPENLTTKRPAFGISPMRWDELMGRHASKGYLPDELIDEA